MYLNISYVLVIYLFDLFFNFSLSIYKFDYIYLKVIDFFFYFLLNTYLI